MFHIEDKRLHTAHYQSNQLRLLFSPDDAKALVQKQVSLSLDAKNANLRSSNNEQKITLLEKKVETLPIALE